MTSDFQATRALRMPNAMPVRTVEVAVTVGPNRGLLWEGEAGTIGTAEDNSLVLSDETVSRYHARINATADGFQVTDLGSTNGTYFGEVRVANCVVPGGT